MPHQVRKENHQRYDYNTIAIIMTQTNLLFPSHFHLHFILMEKLSTHQEAKHYNDYH